MREEAAPRICAYRAPLLGALCDSPPLGVPGRAAAGALRVPTTHEVQQAEERALERICDALAEGGWAQSSRARVTRRLGVPRGEVRGGGGGARAAERAAAERAAAAAERERVALEHAVQEREQLWRRYALGKPLRATPWKPRSLGRQGVQGVC